MSAVLVVKKGTERRRRELGTEQGDLTPAIHAKKTMMHELSLFLHNQFAHGYTKIEFRIRPSLQTLGQKLTSRQSNKCLETPITPALEEQRDKLWNPKQKCFQHQAISRSLSSRKYFRSVFIGVCTKSDQTVSFRPFSVLNFSKKLITETQILRLALIFADFCVSTSLGREKGRGFVEVRYQN